MAVWNCNGSVKLDVGAFEDSVKGRDIIFFWETHQAPGSTLFKVSGYYCETACRQEVRSEYKARRATTTHTYCPQRWSSKIHVG